MIFDLNNEAEYSGICDLISQTLLDNTNIDRFEEGGRIFPKFLLMAESVIPAGSIDPDSEPTLHLYGAGDPLSAGMMIGAALLSFPEEADRFILSRAVELMRRLEMPTFGANLEQIAQTMYPDFHQL